MSVRIVEGETRLINLRTRMPFKYGIATMTDVPYAFLRLAVEIDGTIYEGYSADNLPPKWFTKIPKPRSVARWLRCCESLNTPGKPPSVCRQTLPLICGWTFTKLNPPGATARILLRY